MSDSPAPAISTTLRLSKALGLARQGKLKPAELVLTRDGSNPANPIELHALAALVTHEGDYTRALSLWRQLLQHQPDHPEAWRMIAMIELWQSRPAWHRYVPLAAAVATLLLGAILFWAFGDGNSAATPTVKPAPVSAPPQIAPAPAPPIAPIRPVTPRNQRSR